MTLPELQQFIKTEDGRLRTRFGYADEEKRVLARMVKISEEVGELSDEVLKHSALQREDKLAGHDPENLSGEFADVIITTLLLAETMRVDIEAALVKKIEKINARYK